MKPPEVPFAKPFLGEEERAAVERVLASGWLTTGTETDAFEQDFGRRVGAAHAIATQSCTAALHLSLSALGVSSGQHVVVPSYNFVSAAEAVQHLGAELRWVDCESETLSVDPAALERELVDAAHTGRKTTAVVVTHLGGQPARLAEIDALCRRFQVALVEDAAHALPTEHSLQQQSLADACDVSERNSAVARWSTIGGRRPGAPERRFVCFSFYANKTLTTGEGGMVTTEDEGLASLVRRRRNHGFDRSAWQREAIDFAEVSEGSGEMSVPDPRAEKGAPLYQVTDLGFKYGMGDLAAAIGRAQLNRLGAGLEARREIARRYREIIESRPHVRPSVEAATARSSWHLYFLRADDADGALATRRRNALREALTARGVGHSHHYYPLHLHPHFVGRFGSVGLRTTEEEHARVISLPIYPGLSEVVFDRLAKAIDSVEREL